MLIEINEENYKKFLSNWLTGIQFELEFWESIMNDTNEYHKWQPVNVKQTTSIDDPNIIKILDAGSGPRCVLTPGKDRYIVACDPLALYYNSLLKKHNKETPVNIEFAFSERLYEKYGENSFDETHMSNALDHCFFPMLSIYNLLYIVKIGGKVILRHFRNEAEGAMYTNFHQFNIDIQNNEAVLWNRDVTIILKDVLKGIAEVDCRLEIDNYIKREFVIIEITKISNFNILEYIGANHYFDKYIFIAISQLLTEYGNVLDGSYYMLNKNDICKPIIADKINVADDKINEIDDRINVINNQISAVDDRVNVMNNQISAVDDRVNVMNNQISIINDKINTLINSLAWWIPSKKKRDEFRAKFK